MNKLRWGLMAVTYIFVVSCSHFAPVGRQVLTPSYVASNVAHLQGQTVLVRGYLRFGSHARILWDNEAAAEEVNMDRCLTLINTMRVERALNARNRSTVLIRGIVYENVLEDVLDLGACSEPGLEILEIIE